MTIPNITPLSDPPDRDTDTAEEFVPKANTSFSEFPTMVDEFNDMIDALNPALATVEEQTSTVEAAVDVVLNAVTLVATSITSLTLSAGAKAVEWAEASRTFADDLQATLVRQGDRTAKMWGVLSDVDNVAKTATLTVAVDDFAGAGTYDDWILMPSVWERLAEGTVAQIWAKSAHVAISPDVARDANAGQALVMGGTVTVDGAAGLRRTLACNGSFTLAAPINVDPGDVIEIDVTHTAGGNVLAVNSALKRRNGLGVLSTTNGHRDLIIIIVQTVDGSRTCTRGIYQVVQNPT